MNSVRGGIREETVLSPFVYVALSGSQHEGLTRIARGAALFFQDAPLTMGINERIKVQAKTAAASALLSVMQRVG